MARKTPPKKVAEVPEEKAPDTFTINVNGKDQEIFMSFHLLNLLTTLVGRPENVGFITMDGNLREAILIECLVPRNEKGRPTTQEFDLWGLDVSTEEILDLLDWVTEHVTDFFTRAVERQVRHLEKNKAKLSALATSLIGRADSPSKNQPASPSESAPQS